MKTQLRISAKTLGLLALPTFCPRCFWVRMRCGDKLPFQIFPGIFASIDSYSKKVTERHVALRGRIPRWFDGFGDLGTPIPVPHWSKFNVVDPETNILLTGVPDEILRHQLRGLWIGDYKCARFSNTQDDLAQMYVTQLNAYAFIAPRVGLGSVYGLGLLYYEPVTDIAVTEVDALVGDDAFSMRFAPKLLPIKVQPDLIPLLLQRARDICDLPSVPTSAPGCRDCMLLDALVAVTGGSGEEIAGPASRTVPIKVIASKH